MSCESLAVVKWENETAELLSLSFWSNYSHGNSHGLDDPLTMKSFTERYWFWSRNKIKGNAVWKWRTWHLIFLRPNDTLHTLQTWLSCILWSRVVDENHPALKSKSSNSTSCRQEWGICQLSSSLKSHSWKKKKSTSFLPGFVLQPGFRRKALWCSSHTRMIIHNSSGMLQRWELLEMWLCQTDNKRHIFWWFSVQKQLGNFFQGCQNSCSCAMWIYKGHKREWIPVLSVLWPFTKLCCYSVFLFCWSAVFSVTLFYLHILRIFW